MSRVSYILLVAISNIFLLSLSQEEKRFNPGCPSFSCGSLGIIGFPFSNRTHPECGLCIVDDCDKPVQRIQLGKQGPWFYASSISMDNTVVLHYQNPLGSRTCGSINLSLPVSAFLSFGLSHQPIIFKCPLNYSFPTNLPFVRNDSRDLFLCYPSRVKLPSSLSQCSRIPFLVNKTQKRVELFNLSTVRFALKVNVTKECYDCYLAGGQCQTDRHGKFNCSITKRTGGLCQTDAKGKFKCSVTERASDGKSELKLSIGLSISGTAILMVLAFFFSRKLSQPHFVVFGNKKTKDFQNIEAFLRNYGSLAPRRYDYADIKKMTNSFGHKLGQGGYGAVYKGKLLDGCCVAVKVLTASRGNGEEFINEVASISKTSHVNIVTLLGFCFEGRKRALIYEFMSNGSLEKFMHEKSPLKWETLYQIAIGIARGLEYLHRGCNTRILHFDIKPHNILLDEDFCPKISDFGLAKICPKKESIVSMTGARGTIGYIAPEIIFRNFGAVSHKSDVYSYGMMILEITGGRQNNNVQADNSSESYFPQWIYERLEDEELGLHGISSEKDRESVRKMIIVSLWCIQTNPSERPTMSRVVEMLEGSLHSLSIPPRPFLSSPRSAPRDSSISLPI